LRFFKTLVEWHSRRVGYAHHLPRRLGFHGGQSPPLRVSPVTLRPRIRLGKALRPWFHRRFFGRWTGSTIEVCYWDGHRAALGGGPSQATLEFRCPSVLIDMLASPSCGFGNAYVDGRLRIEGDLQAVLRPAFAGGSLDSPPGMLRLLHRLRYPVACLLHFRAADDARFHYDLGNEFFRQWLDPSMTYSCGYFRDANDDLETAQRQKREMICRKLNLEPGQRLLDVGCGWGALLFDAIEHYGVEGVGVTPSREQAAWLRAEAERRGVASRLTLHVADWRSVGGTYDRVVSVGMFEHVGKAFGRRFLARWRRWLKPGGISLLHTIGKMTGEPPDPWIERNIFPGGYLPSLGEISDHAARAGLMIADVENLWRHYAMTLEHWSANFAHAREGLEAMTDEAFIRMWRLYLNASQAAFATGCCQLWQLVLVGDKTAPLPLTRAAWLNDKPRGTP
jgi:cyclopropane-fatty-acyl-phospholipid synthase